MKIAIPTSNGLLAAHFGHCEQFAMFDVDTNSKAIEGPEFVTPPPHEPGLLPRWLHEQQTNVIIAGGMGQRAQDLFTERGIQVVVGAPAEEPKSIVSAYVEGTLATSANSCDH